MFRRIFLLLAISPLIFQCTHDNDGSSNPLVHANHLPAALDTGIYNGACLNLQKLAEYVNDERFSYPGFKYVSDYKVSDGAGGELEKSLTARTVEFRQMIFNSLSEFEGARQENCDSVQLPVSGPITATYKITMSTPTSLNLELVPFETPPMPARPQGQKFLDNIKLFPLVKAYEISVNTATELAVTASHRLAPSSCDPDRKVDVKETTVYTWGALAPAQPAQLKLTPAFAQRLKDLFPSFDWEAPLPRDEAAVEIKSDVVEKFMASPYELESACVF